MGDYETILWEQDDDGVGWVTLDRPHRHNAFDETMREELASLWKRLSGDGDVRCVVLTASGDKAFCTGIDREEVPAEGGDDLDFDPLTWVDPGMELGPRSNGLWTPVIAAVNGMACGGAFYLLGEVDFVIAADHATFFDPHVTYGMPAVYEPVLMSAKMPFGEISRLTLMGNHERMTAARAHQIGLVSEVVPGAELREAAGRAAAAIASQPPGPVRATVRALWTARELTVRQTLEMGGHLLQAGMTAEDLAAGQEVFASGKRIEWRAR